MGVFNNLFGGKKEQEKEKKEEIPWIPLNDIAQLAEITSRSNSKTQVIFKHSTTCGISRMVLNMFTGNYGFTKEQIDLYFLDLHAHRAVSDETGYHFQVIHQSPQLIVVRNGTVVQHASHGAIAEVSIDRFI